MAHYAFLNDKNVVTEVITGKDENLLLDGLSPEEWYSNFRGQRCIRTSYNGNIRNKFAGIGDWYLEDYDVFISPQPYDSWELDFNTFEWYAPVPYPEDEYYYDWDEETLSWVITGVKSV